MKTSRSADVLELALIGVEYAIADFIHQRSAGSLEDQRRGLETLLSKLLKISRTIQAAITALDAADPVAAPSVQHRRTHRRRFAA